MWELVSQGQEAGRDQKMWERACSRMRCASHQLHQLTHRFACAFDLTTQVGCQAAVLCF